MSKYEVLARKWRPQTFENLIGQNHVSQTLFNALKSGRIPHALLFTGPRGTGKTSSARILAKALRCQNSKNFAPCGECSDCKDIALGRHIDVIEIDGASNNGVDSVRELRDAVGFMPASGFYKIFIIDEVHMLSTSAFNALLKTLEEPPEHVVFILATTEAQKVPNTILSRCQRFDFKTISQKEICDHLSLICKEEGVNFTPEAIWLISKQAKGSMRDGQSLLDQIITFCDKDISLQRVTEILGLSARELLNRSLQAITEQDPLSLSQILSEMNLAGADPALFLEDLLEQLRNALMVKMKAHKKDFPVHLPESEIKFLETLTKNLSHEDIHLLFDITLRGSQNLVRTTDSRLALEMLLLKLSAAPRIQALDQIMSGQAIAPPPRLKKNTTQVPQAIKAVPQNAPTQQRPAPTAQLVNPAVSAKAAQTDPWLQFVDSVRKSNGLLAALIEHTFILRQDSKELVLGLPEKMKFLMDKVADPKNIKKLETCIKDNWKKNLAVSIEVSSGPTAKPVTPVQKVKKAQDDKLKHQQQQVEAHPLVKKTQSLFKTEIVSITEEKTT